MRIELIWTLRDQVGFWRVFDTIFDTRKKISILADLPPPTDGIEYRGELIK